MQTFEQNWRNRLKKAIEDAGRSADILPADGEPAAWTKQTMECLREHFSPEEMNDIMTRPACRYSESDLTAMRKVYLDTGSVDAVMARFQTGFESMLRERLGLSEDEIKRVRQLGMGPAGVRKGNVIVSTKIPKSGWLRQWLQESDAAKRRAIYCHCPRIRNQVTSGEAFDEAYCYCGAGFYRHIWETVLEREVKVRVLASIIRGDDFCRIEITLPDGIVK